MKSRFEKFYEEYWQWWKGKSAYQALKKKLNFLKKYAPKNGSILDLG